MQMGEPQAARECLAVLCVVVCVTVAASQCPGLTQVPCVSATAAATALTGNASYFAVTNAVWSGYCDPNSTWSNVGILHVDSFGAPGCQYLSSNFSTGKQAGDGPEQCDMQPLYARIRFYTWSTPRYSACTPGMCLCSLSPPLNLIGIESAPYHPPSIDRVLLHGLSGAVVLSTGNALMATTDTNSYTAYLDDINITPAPTNMSLDDPHLRTACIAAGETRSTPSLHHHTCL